ncbi:MAG: HAMP domain-containing histidine kinase, partial [Sphingobacteriales bacterium]|nr:HAMP domain-containing histidine kinase [Sphingobacteriales bacterium]
GATAARSLIKRSTLEEEISYREMYAIIQENQKVREFNRELMKKSAELQKASSALKKANEELNKADQIKNEFLYTVTHELKTPLTSIIALSEIVLDNPDLDETTKEMYLQSTINEANRLANLINQVLRIEKFEAGKQRLNLSQVDLRDLVREVAQTLEGSIQMKALQLELQLTNAMMLLSCDRDLIKQVLVNLMGNALKYAKTKITVHTHFTEDEWQVWVSDDGKGIDAGEKELIFDKFFQAQNQSLRKPEGSGLGLAISKKIIDLHNGRIWADTSYAVGAHIAFSLPAHFDSNDK